MGYPDRAFLRVSLHSVGVQTATPRLNLATRLRAVWTSTSTLVRETPQRYCLKSKAPVTVRYAQAELGVLNSTLTFPHKLSSQ